MFGEVLPYCSPPEHDRCHDRRFNAPPRHSGTRIVLRAWAISFSSWRRGDVVHFIEEGVVHLIRHQTDGSALVLQRAGAGSILAEASLYSQKYHCDAVAQTQARLLALPKKKITTHLATNTAFSEAWARHLAHEVQKARLQAEILSLHTVAARLSAWIAWNDGSIPEKGEWKAIGGQIGVSPEVLYRELAKRRSNRP
jgi:CRP/FNR family transcriptional regulator, dissimilatory nitrate respiration regulator